MSQSPKKKLLSQSPAVAASTMRKRDEEEEGQQLENIKHTVVGLRNLKRRMKKALEHRRNLKAQLTDSEYILDQHHATYALENVSMFKQVDTLRAELTERESVVRQLESDLKFAETEHERLVTKNNQLLAVVRDCEESYRVLRSRLDAFGSCERRTLKLAQSIATNAETLIEKRSNVQARTVGFMGKLGLHHGELMSIEQEALELRLDVDSLRSKLGFPARSDTVNLAYTPYFRCCKESECAKSRGQMRFLQEQVSVLQASIASLQQVLNSTSQAVSGLGNSSFPASSPILGSHNNAHSSIGSRQGSPISRALVAPSPDKRRRSTLRSGGSVGFLF